MPVRARRRSSQPGAIEHEAGRDEARVHAVLGGGGEADVDGGGGALAVLLEDVGAVELVGRGLDHLRLRRRRAVVDDEDHRARGRWREGDERLEERLDVLGALGAHGDDDEGGDGFHVSYIGCPRRDLRDVR